MKVFTETLAPNSAQLTCYLQDLSPKMPNADLRPAMLVLPGGGYQYCSDREAEPVALAYMTEGYNAFVLRYTVGPDFPIDKALQDGRAALEYIRAHADALHIDPHRVAVVGFSAGGHLAAALGTQSVDVRPDAMVLGYAVTLGSAWAVNGIAAPDLGDLVDDATPPAFIFATQGDSLIPVKNSLLFADALADHDIPFALHIFQTGDHGLSLAKPCTSSGDVAQVNDETAAWLPLSVQFLRDLWGGFGVESPVPELAAQMGNVALTLDAPLKRLLKNPAAAEVLARYFPDEMPMLRGNGALAGASLRKLASFAGDRYPTDLLDAVDAELAKI